MTEGLLSTGTTPGSYAIASLTGVDLMNEQAIEVFLGGQWIAGHIAYSDGSAAPSRIATQNEIPSMLGMYHITDGRNNDSVEEASGESFPASDSPAWTETGSDTEKTIQRVFNGPYFVADVDGSVCGLCIGMRVRTL